MVLCMLDDNTAEYAMSLALDVDVLKGVHHMAPFLGPSGQQSLAGTLLASW